MSIDCAGAGVDPGWHCQGGPLPAGASLSTGSLPNILSSVGLLGCYILVPGIRSAVVISRPPATGSGAMKIGTEGHTPQFGSNHIYACRGAAQRLTTKWGGRGGCHLHVHSSPLRPRRRIAAASTEGRSRLVSAQYKSGGSGPRPPACPGTSSHVLAPPRMSSHVFARPRTPPSHSIVARPRESSSHVLAPSSHPVMPRCTTSCFRFPQNSPNINIRLH
jgi:hypothetical protein